MHVVIEVIESVTENPNLLMWKFDDEGLNIRDGAKLIVRESQAAMLLYKGQLAGVFAPGCHSLSVEQIPLLKRLTGWNDDYQNPYQVDVYFFNTQQFINNKWGTPAPLLMRDSEFGNVRIRAFGSFDVRIADPAAFFKQYAGTYEHLTIIELQTQLRDFIAPKFAEILANEHIPLMEVAGNVSALSEKIQPVIAPYFVQLGLELMHFVITSVSLPDEVLRQLDTVSGMNMVTDMNRYAAFQAANGAGSAIGAASAAAVQGAAMMAAMQQQAQTDDLTARLTKLKKLFDDGLIDENEYKTKKADILAKMI